MKSKHKTRYQKYRTAMIQQEKSRTIHTRDEHLLINGRTLEGTAAAIKLAWLERGIPTPPDYINPIPALAEVMKTADEHTWAAAVLIMAEEHGIEGAEDDVTRNRAALAHNRLAGCRPVDVVHIMIDAREDCARHHNH